MKTIIFILAITWINATSAEYQSALNDLKSSSFGETLLETIQMHLQTEEPISNLIDMFEDLNNKIAIVQDKSDTSYQRIYKKCQSDIGQLNDQIQSLSIRSVTLKSELDVLNPQLKSAVATVERKELEIKEYKNELTESHKYRVYENTLYKSILDQLEQSLFGINEVKNYFGSFVNSVQKAQRQFKSFAELSKPIKQVRQTIKQEGYKALVSLLLDITLKVEDDQEYSLELASKVISILKQVEQYISKERIREDTAEQQREDAYQEYKAMISDNLVNSNRDYVLMQGLLESVSNSVTSNVNDKAGIDARLQAKLREHADISAECTAFQIEHETQTSGRTAQTKLIDAALQLTATSLGKLKAELLSNVQ